MAMFSLFAPISPDSGIKEGAVIQSFRDLANRQGVELPTTLKPYRSVENGMPGLRVDVETDRPCPRT